MYILERLTDPRSFKNHRIVLNFFSRVLLAHDFNRPQQVMGRFKTNVLRIRIK